jgi:hypothetical protein
VGAADVDAEPETGCRCRHLATPAGMVRPFLRVVRFIARIMDKANGRR